MPTALSIKKQLAPISTIKFYPESWRFQALWRGFPVGYANPDIAATPHLLDWYRRRGFEVILQSNGPAIIAVATIFMGLHAAELSIGPGE